MRSRTKKLTFWLMFWTWAFSTISGRNSRRFLSRQVKMRTLSLSLRVTGDEEDDVDAGAEELNEAVDDEVLDRDIFNEQWQEQPPIF